MGITINPFTGQLDMTGSGGGASPTPNYSQSFNATTDWGSPSGGKYSISISAASHGKGTKPVSQVFELVGSDFFSIGMAIKMDGSGNITLEVIDTPDNRFAGKIIISENN